MAFTQLTQGEGSLRHAHVMHTLKSGKKDADIEVCVPYVLTHAVAVWRKKPKKTIIAAITFQTNRFEAQDGAYKIQDDDSIGMDPELLFLIFSFIFCMYFCYYYDLIMWDSQST